MNRIVQQIFCLCLSISFSLCVVAQENTVINTIDSVVRHINLTKGKSYSFTNTEGDTKWMNTVKLTKDGYTLIKRISLADDRIVEQTFYAKGNDLFFSNLLVSRINGFKKESRTGKFYFEGKRLVHPEPVGSDQGEFNFLNPEYVIVRNFMNARIAFQKFQNAVAATE